MKPHCPGAPFKRSGAFLADLGSGFATTTLDIETFYRCNAVPAGEQRIQGPFQADTHRTDDTGSYDGDPLSCHVCRVKCHGLWDFRLRDSYCFLKRSILVMSPKPKRNRKRKLGSWKIVS
jgi:hypothetical protein